MRLPNARINAWRERSGLEGNLVGLLQVATLAKDLNVRYFSAATLRDGDDVVEVQVLLRSAANARAAVARPDKQLHVVGNRVPFRPGSLVFDRRFNVRCPRDRQVPSCAGSIPASRSALVALVAFD